MSYPTSPEFSAIKVESQHSNVRTETRSGRTQVRSLGAQRWAFTAQYNDMTREEFAPVYAFVVGELKKNEVFWFPGVTQGVFGVLEELRIHFRMQLE